MGLRVRHTHAARAAGVASAALVLAGLPVKAGAVDMAGAVDTGGGRTAAAVRTVTLVTGDRVLVGDQGQGSGVERAPGRKDVPVSAREARDTPGSCPVTPNCCTPRAS